MVLSAEIIDVFLRVLQQLRNESNQRLEGLEEHAVDTVSNYLAGLSSVSTLAASQTCGSLAPVL